MSSHNTYNYVPLNFEDLDLVPELDSEEIRNKEKDWCFQNGEPSFGLFNLIRLDCIYRESATERHELLRKWRSVEMGDLSIVSQENEIKARRKITQVTIKLKQKYKESLERLEAYLNEGDEELKSQSLMVHTLNRQSLDIIEDVINEFDID